MANAPGSFCTTSIYSFDLSSNTGKAMYAAALGALLAKNKIKLELASVGCGAGPAAANALQSIYVVSN
jgi:hypothetical protein